MDSCDAIGWLDCLGLIGRGVMQTELDVPFAEKDEAKRLGAKWNGSTWYIPAGIASEPFRRWMPPSQFEITSAGYFVARSVDRCWKCRACQHVYGFLLPPGWKEADSEILGRYHSRSGHAFVTFVQRLNPVSLGSITGITPTYGKALTKSHGKPYFANRCSGCNAIFGDHFLFGEPGGAFFPTSAGEAEGIFLQWFDEPFACDGGWSVCTEDFFIGSMRRGVLMSASAPGI